MTYEINLLQERPGGVSAGVSLSNAVLAALGAGVLLLAVAGWFHLQEGRLAQRVAVLEATLRPPVSGAAPADLPALEHALAVHRTTLELLQEAGSNDRKGFAEDFHGLARQATEGVWLVGVRLDREANTVRGKALSPDRISIYLAGLRNEPLFAGHAFDSIDLHAPQDGAGKDATAGPGAIEFTLASRAMLVAAGNGAATGQAP